MSYRGHGEPRNDSRPRADPGPASGRVSPDPGASDPGHVRPGAKGTWLTICPSELIFTRPHPQTTVINGKSRLKSYILLYYNILVNQYLPRLRAWCASVRKKAREKRLYERALRLYLGH